MVAELQFQRVGIEIDLLFQVCLIVFPYVMIHESHWHNQGNESLMVFINNLQEFLLLIGGEVFLEVAHDVMKDIGVLRLRWLDRHCPHEEFLILRDELLFRELLCMRHEMPHLLKMFRTVGHEKQFVPGVKLHEIPDMFFFLHYPTVAPVSKDAFDEVLPQDRVVEPAILLDWYQWEVFHEDPREYSHPDFSGHPLVVIYLNALHSARWRVAFKNETADVVILEFVHTLPGPGLHPVCVIDTRVARHKAWLPGVTHESESFSRNAKTAFHLGAHRQIMNILAQGISQKAVQRMSAVVAYIFTQKAGAYAERDLSHESALKHFHSPPPINGRTLSRWK